MSQSIHVLIIENEHLIVHVLKNAIQTLSGDTHNFNVKVANGCQEAKQIMLDYDHFDLVLLNTNLPPSEEGQLTFVEDIALKIKKDLPQAKLILFSSIMDNYKIGALLEQINPDSVMIKSNIDFEELTTAINTVLSSPPYYCKSILRFIRQQVSQNIKLDRTDRSILYYLSKGNKTKDLPNLVHLSGAAVEQRKRKLKDLFGIHKGGDHMLLENARAKGIV